MFYLLELPIVLRRCRDRQQLFLVFLDLFLEAHVLLTDHRLQLPQLRSKIKNTNGSDGGAL